MEQVGFKDLGISPERLAAIEALGWVVPTPIQTKAIPSGLEGIDVVGIAQTGTGKTAAFMIPALERLRVGEGLQVLVLCPTRELAQQVAEDTEALAKGTKVQGSRHLRRRRLRTADQGPGGRLRGDRGHAGEVHRPHPVEAGRSQQRALPGLDEADRMLDMGFRPQIEQCIRDMPRKRQTMLFSATMPHGVHDLALRITKREAVWIEATPPGTTAEGIEELFYSVKPEKKPDLLLELDHPARLGSGAHLHPHQGRRRRARGPAAARGHPTDAMHSDKHMKHRTRALDRFASGKVRVLVATDLAQRGLDVEGISHVVNYDVPLDPEDYVHRIGRTGPRGREGTAVTFVTASDLGALKSLEHRLGREVERIHLPEFDYAGTPQTETRAAAARGRKSRSPTGMGSRSASELSPGGAGGAPQSGVVDAHPPGSHRSTHEASMIFRRYGTAYQSVDLNFDSLALNEVAFRRNREESIPADDFDATHQVLATHELVAEAEGDVQDETEEMLLEKLEAQVEELRGAWGTRRSWWSRTSRGTTGPRRSRRRRT